MFTTTLTPEYFLPNQTWFSVAGEEGTVELNVKVLPDWFKEMDLSWEVLPAWASKEPRFNVYRSEIEHSGYLKLNNVPLLDPFFKDESTLESSKAPNEFYIVEALLNDNSVWRTKPTIIGGGLPRWHAIRLREIQRREWILLRKFTGSEAMVMRHIKYAPLCPNCRDPVSEKLIKDNCTVCYGTGRERGYYNGYKTLIQFDASSDSAVYTYFGKMEANQIGAWTINEPQIEPFDVVIRLADFKVFRVKDVSNTEILRNMSRQIMRLDELAKNDILYKLLQREDVRS